MYNDPYELNSEYGLASIIKEAYKKDLYVTGIEDPMRRHRYGMTEDGVKKRLEIVNNYAVKVIEHAISIENDHIPEVVILCGLAHLDQALNEYNVNGIRQSFKQATSYIAIDRSFKDQLPEGILELPKPQEKSPCCVM